MALLSAHFSLFSPHFSLVFCVNLRYIESMTIEQTIDIPANRRVSLDLPPELPVGRAKITVTPKFDEYTVKVAFDNEAQKWYAQNDVIPIILEDDSLDTLVNRFKLAAPEMLEINDMPRKNVKLFFNIEPQAVIM
jgi:hypothetical protein